MQGEHIYVMIQGRNLTDELILGMKANLKITDVIKLTYDTFLLIKRIEDSENFNRITINLIQKIYDLFIHRTIKIYIVDIVSNNTTTDNIKSLDQLYRKTQFQHTAKTITRQGMINLLVSTVDENNVKITYQFSTSFVSRELFHRGNLLNNHITPISSIYIKQEPSPSSIITEQHYQFAYQQIKNDIKFKPDNDTQTYKQKFNTIHKKQNYNQQIKTQLFWLTAIIYVILKVNYIQPWLKI